MLPGGNQGGLGYAGKNGETYTNNFSIAFNTLAPTIVAVHRGTAQAINIVVDSSGGKTSFAARSTYTTSSAAIAYIACGH